VLDRLPPELHCLGRLIEPLLHGVEHTLVFPPPVAGSEISWLQQPESYFG
jgi:hypothetical protein